MATRTVSHFFFYGIHLLHIEIKIGQQRIVSARIPSVSMFPLGGSSSHLHNFLKMISQVLNLFPFTASLC